MSLFTKRAKPQPPARTARRSSGCNVCCNVCGNQIVIGGGIAEAAPNRWAHSGCVVR